MRSFDFAPLYRATIGFDQIADMMDRVSAHDVGQSSYPPYNIEKTAEDGYRISIAVAGFSEVDLGIEVKEITGGFTACLADLIAHGLVLTENQSYLSVAIPRDVQILNRQLPLLPDTVVLEALPEPVAAPAVSAR